MSLALAIVRGGLDIAHGLFDRVLNWAERLFDRILTKTGIALTRFELTELVNITEDSREAANQLWSGGAITKILPVVWPPVFMGGEDIPFGGYQTKILSKITGPSGGQTEKKVFYFEWDEMPDKIRIEDYISKFWREHERRGFDSGDVTLVDIGGIENIPIYIVARGQAG